MSTKDVKNVICLQVHMDLNSLVLGSSKLISIISGAPKWNLDSKIFSNNIIFWNKKNTVITSKNDG